MGFYVFLFLLNVMHRFHRICVFNFSQFALESESRLGLIPAQILLLMS